MLNFLAPGHEVPSLKDGEVLLQTLAITIGAGQRAGLQGSASYAGAAQAVSNGKRVHALLVAALNMLPRLGLVRMS